MYGGPEKVPLAGIAPGNFSPGFVILLQYEVRLLLPGLMAIPSRDIKIRVCDRFLRARKCGKP